MQANPLRKENDMSDMFCFQCEQTARGTGCTTRGVCGKPAEVANEQDRLTYALMKLASAYEGKEVPTEINRLMISGLFTCVTNVNFEESTIDALIDEVCAATRAVTGETSCDCKTAEIAPLALWEENEDIRSLKSLILLGLRGTAAYAYHAMVLGFEDPLVYDIFFDGLRAVSDETATMETLLPLVLAVGGANYSCMELLDRANTETYGTPTPVTVPLDIEPGPFIVITGHDLKDLELLLKQTEGKGINIYTHGEMLPAHGYPKLKAYSHLKGNYGTAWQNQQKEFADMPAPVLFTTNCIMPVRDSYADRVFTTELVHFPEMVHIGEDKDFTPIIEKALELGGYPEFTEKTGINGGHSVTTGFGHGTILSVADDVVGAVKAGDISHFFLVGGCDGAKPGRNYYTDFVKQTPADSIILTLACGKFRFNDLDLGTVAGLPRILDMGQCNDAYGAVKVALALADAFECGVNDLPLTLVLSWYEQKAVCILLTLLALGVKNIYLGPTLPAFVSPAVLDFLVENFELTPTSTPEEDLAKILG